ncbi:Crp/Fnr family transcriptional regulator [Pedobacter sp. AJM]|uniref:Crp/Fnr family transcriptional regulator n=1 Tax=Pedobacter sp. AJM TaxID=2003629 RepID=UPI000B4B2F91|nr:Crp/Fnr family transcriptional regulator [Pedobacter sp. AJM]OWK72531.1 cyclic nucleotide-binding protein [Pedobacter sp. AJM]
MYQQLSNYISHRIEISEHDLKTVLSFFTISKVKRNEHLVSPGQISNKIYFVTKGCLRIYFLNEKGSEATRLFAFEDQFVTALVSFVTEAKSLEFVQATESTTLLSINKTDFYNLLTIVPHWEKLYRHYLEYAYVTNTNRLMSFITSDATERYQQLLHQHPIIVKRLSNKMIASYLNISPETLSRLKSKG